MFVLHVPVSSKQIVFIMAPGLRSVKSSTSNNNKIWKCPICGKTICKSAYSVGCSSCPDYFHPKCIGISDVTVRTNRSLTYTCKMCEQSMYTTVIDTANEAANRCADVIASDDNVDGARSDVVSVLHGSYEGIMNALSSKMQKTFHDLEETFKHKFEELQACSTSFQAVIDDAINSIRREFIDGLRKVRDDVKLCMQKIDLIDIDMQCCKTKLAKVDGLVDQVDCLQVKVSSLVDKVLGLETNVMSLENKVETLTTEKNILHRRLNRANFVIRGLPRGIRNLSREVLKIGELCNVDLSMNSIQHCCYFEAGESILVKLNSVQTRDLIMANFQRGPPIRVNDVMGGSSRKRIFLNDHLTPDASRLVFLCRQLLSSKKLKRYTLINGDSPKVKAVMEDGAMKILSIKDCESISNDVQAVIRDV